MRKKQHRFTQNLIIIFIVCIIAFIIYQFSRFFNRPYVTDVAMEYIVSDSLNVTGFAVRNESIIPVSPKGEHIKYTFNNASNIKKDSIIAEVYKSESDIINIDKCERIENELSSLKDIASMSVTELKPTGAISGEINSLIKNIMDSSQEKSLENVEFQKIKLSELINKKKIYMGMNNDCMERVEFLTKELDETKKKISPPVQTIKSPSSGYFSRYTDGFEESYNFDFLDDLTIDKLNKSIKQTRNKQQKQNSVGKIVNDFNWYYAVPLKKSDADKFRLSQSVTINFHISSLSPIPAIVDDIIISSNSDKAIVVLRCDYITEETLQIRNCDADISFRKYAGLKLPADCIRFKDNVKGVYVLGSYKIDFVPVNIIYEEKEFVLCNDNYYVDGKGLQMYDKVVVEGVVEDGQQIKNWRS